MFGLGKKKTIPDTWRRANFPECPSCQSPAATSLHRGCPDKRAVKKGENERYVDIETGVSHCIACGASHLLNEAKYYCDDCGAVFVGGDIWQGMAAEIRQSRQSRRIAGILVQLGTMERRVVGWSKCAACGAEEKNRRITGTMRAGICDKCLSWARGKRHQSLYFGGTRKKAYQCSYCGHNGKEVDRLIALDNGFICSHCIDRL